MSNTHISLFKRANGVWYIRFEEEGRLRWKSTGAKLKYEALRSLTAFRETIKPRAVKILFSEFVRQYCELQSTNLRRSTISRIYQPAFRSFQSVCGDKLLSAYTLKDVETFKSIRIRTCAPTTVNIEFRSLRAAFTKAVKWQFLRDNPFVNSSPIKIPERLPVHFSREDFRLFMSMVREPFLKDLFLFAALTGLRQGEILNLGWRNVDIERRLIIVANSDSFVTKSGRCRMVPMNDHVFELLCGRAATRGFSERVFHRRGRPLSQSYVEHRFKYYLREARLDDELKFHSLRHTFATWLVQSGVGLYQVQKLLGHSDIRTTEVYSHLASEELHSAVNRIAVTLN
jgi:integrase